MRGSSLATRPTGSSRSMRRGRGRCFGREAMPLVPLTTLLADARAARYAVGYFEAWDGYSLEAVVEAAEAERAPVILGFGCLLVDSAWLDNGGIEALGGLGRPVAERARIPACLLLNETHTLEQARRGLDAGFTALMMHTGRESPAGAVEKVGALVPATGVDCLAVSFGNVPLLEGRAAPVDLDRLAAVQRRVDVPLVVHGGTSFPPEAAEAGRARGVAKVNVGAVLK